MPTTPSILYSAASRTRAVAANPPRDRFPLPQTSPIQFAAYAADQDFEMLMANYPPAPKNTPSNAVSGGTPVFAGLLDGNAILTKLSQPSPSGGGKGKFTGSFARVPASWDDFQTMQVTFPGWLGYNSVGYIESGNTRPQKTTEVLVRIRHDYFVIDPDGILTDAGVLDSGGGAIARVAVKGAIVQILRQQFFSQYSGTPIPYSDAKDLVPTGGLVDASNNFYCPTVPSVSSYQGWCATASDLVAAWDATHPATWDGDTDSTSYGQWCFRDSVLEDYEGNIVDRQSFYVLAK